MSESTMAQRIKFRREELGLTLEEVGNAVGVGKSTVRKWETGMIENMRRDKIASLANALKTSPGYLMGWEDKKEVADDELESYLEELRTRPEMRMLFSISKDATKEDVEATVRIIEALKKSND